MSSPDDEEDWETCDSSEYGSRLMDLEPNEKFVLNHPDWTDSIFIKKDKTDGHDVYGSPGEGKTIIMEIIPNANKRWQLSDKALVLRLH